MKNLTESRRFGLDLYKDMKWPFSDKMKTYVDDFMTATLWRCEWHNYFVSDFFNMKNRSPTNISKRSPLVTHEHQCKPDYNYLLRIFLFMSGLWTPDRVDPVPLELIKNQTTLSISIFVQIEPLVSVHRVLGVCNSMFIWGSWIYFLF